MFATRERHRQPRDVGRIDKSAVLGIVSGKLSPADRIRVEQAIGAVVLDPTGDLFDAAGIRTTPTIFAIDERQTLLDFKIGGSAEWINNYAPTATAI